MKKYLKITLLVVIAIILVGTFVFLSLIHISEPTRH